MKVFPYKLTHKDKAEECSKNTNKLSSEIENATEFVKNIENGNLDSPYNGLEEGTELDKNSLPGSLISMRDQMKTFAEQERERNWATEGLAKFVEILRSNNEDLNGLSDKILSNLIKYLNVNQGYLFVLDDSDNADPFLALVSSYAYNKKKFISKRLEIGEGLVGQCYLEKETIYITDVPENYIYITSGLGEATPRNIIIVPLKLNDNVYGVVEMASFEPIKKYQVEFLEKLGESIASTIAILKVHDRTKKLLNEAQVMAEQMRSQEEEMRQNMEELSATQEEMPRRETELKDANVRFNLVIQSSSEGLWDMPHDPNATDSPIWYSEEFCALLGFKQSEFPPVLSTWAVRIHPEEADAVVNAFTSHINDVTGKTPFDIDYRLKLKSGEYRWFKSRSTTIRDEFGNAIRSAGSAKDIHEEKTSIEKLNKTMSVLAEQEAYMNGVLNATTEMIITLDTNYVVKFANQAAVNNFKKNGQVLDKGINIFSIFTEEQKPVYKQYYERVLKGESVEATKVYFEHTFSMVYNPLKTAEGEIIGITAFTKDITKLVQMQKETEILLTASQQQAEELKAQEEELRQNMEELSATQEEMNRLLDETQEQEAFMSSLLNSSTDSIVTVDKNLIVINCNDALKASYSGYGLDVRKGFDLSTIFTTEEEKAKYKTHYDRAFKGETFQVVEHYQFGEINTYFSVRYSPLKNKNGEIIAAACFASDVTPLVMAQKEAEVLLASSQQQSEELKAQEEELRQNMEELSATQEEMQNVLAEVQENEFNQTELLSLSSDSILTLDRDNKVLTHNKVFASTFEAKGLKVGKGFEILNIFTKEDQVKKIALYKKIFEGETIEILDHLSIDGFDNYYKVTHSPIRNKEGQITSIGICAKDVTELTKLRQQTEHLSTRKEGKTIGSQRKVAA